MEGQYSGIGVTACVWHFLHMTENMDVPEYCSCLHVTWYIAMVSYCHRHLDIGTLIIDMGFIFPAVAIAPHNLLSCMDQTYKHCIHMHAAIIIPSIINLYISHRLLPDVNPHYVVSSYIACIIC